VQVQFSLIWIYHSPSKLLKFWETKWLSP